MPETADRTLLHRRVAKRRKSRKKVRAAFFGMTQRIQTAKAELAPLQTYAKNIATSGAQVSVATKKTKQETGASFVKGGVSLATAPITLRDVNATYPSGVVAVATNPPTFAVDPAGKLQAPKHFGGKVRSTVQHEVTHLVGQRVTGQYTSEAAIKAAGVDLPGSPKTTGAKGTFAAVSLDVAAAAGDPAAKRKLAKFSKWNP